MAKKLLINCGTCDARNAKEETLAAYESIVINCGDLLVTPETKTLLNRYGVTMNCGDMLELEKGVKYTDINGSATISGNTEVQGETYLTVNGSLTIEADAGEVLKSYVGINVNGNVTCPESLSGYLGKMSVNGSTVCYPDGAILLKKNAVIDKLFVLRAKARQYWSSGRLVMTDPQLSGAALEEKGASFSCKEVIIAEGKVEELIGLIDEKAEIIIVPDGTKVAFDDVELDEAAVKKYGTKLYILGDLEVEQEAVEFLEKMAYLNVSGDVCFPEEIKRQVMAAVTEISGEYKVRKPFRGKEIKGKLSLRISKWLLEREAEGVLVRDCMSVSLDDDISNEQILEKLCFRSCLNIKCSEEQEAAVSAVAEDVLNVGQEGGDMSVGGIVKGALGIGKELLDTKVINAGDYVL